MYEEVDVGENYCFFGTPLDSYDEDAFPKKKPICVEDQVATDTQGRRRFHGAFTGGFSAGFYNTVGSLEGWTPSEFLSSRNEKAKNIVQRPEDFMDDEDLGVHGIAPHTVRATNEYSTRKKRKRDVFNDGPIPGEPVLETFLSGGNETIGYLLLKNIGIQEKINRRNQELETCTNKTYGCQMPNSYEISESIKKRQYQIHILYKENLANPKLNSFGLGYQGLNKTHVNLFVSTNLVVQDKNKKLSIGGQAFGVGAFEEDDEDIYNKEDMSNYDFELTREKKLNKQTVTDSNLFFDMFTQSKRPLIRKTCFAVPNIPSTFTGKHKVRKSRFEPLEVKPEEIDRSNINPVMRAECLGENVNRSYTKLESVEKTEKVLNEENNLKKEFGISSLLMSNRFVSASQKEDMNNIIEPVKKMETSYGTKDMREAARMKMFGPLTRITEIWHPCSMLCKRFNVPEPFMDFPDKNRKRTKNLIFENQKYNDEEVLLTSGVREDVEVFVEENCGSKNPESGTSHTVDFKQENNATPVIDITEKIDIAEKTDLFKAIFLSSSESENEDNEKQVEQVDKTEELKSAILSETLIPKFTHLKQGILSHVNSHIFTKPLQTKPTDDPESRIDISLYGPALPAQKLEVSHIPTVSNSSDDEWVEKDRDNNGCRERHKKGKKKSKHKKHKHQKKSKH